MKRSSGNYGNLDLDSIMDGIEQYLNEEDEGGALEGDVENRDRATGAAIDIGERGDHLSSLKKDKALGGDDAVVGESASNEVKKYASSHSHSNDQMVGMIAEVAKSRFVEESGEDDKNSINANLSGVEIPVSHSSHPHQDVVPLGNPMKNKVENVRHPTHDSIDLNVERAKGLNNTSGRSVPLLDAESASETFLDEEILNKHIANDVDIENNEDELDPETIKNAEGSPFTYEPGASVMKSDSTGEIGQDKIALVMMDSANDIHHAYRTSLEKEVQEPRSFAEQPEKIGHIGSLKAHEEDSAIDIFDDKKVTPESSRSENLVDDFSEKMNSPSSIEDSSFASQKNMLQAHTNDRPVKQVVASTSKSNMAIDCPHDIEERAVTSSKSSSSISEPLIKAELVNTTSSRSLEGEPKLKALTQPTNPSSQEEEPSSESQATCIEQEVACVDSRRPSKEKEGSVDQVEKSRVALEDRLPGEVQMESIDHGNSSTQRGNNSHEPDQRSEVNGETSCKFHEPLEELENFVAENKKQEQSRNLEKPLVEAEAYISPVLTMAEAEQSRHGLDRSPGNEISAKQLSESPVTLVRLSMNPESPSETLEKASKEPSKSCVSSEDPITELKGLIPSRNLDELVRPKEVFSKTVTASAGSEEPSSVAHITSTSLEQGSISSSIESFEHESLSNESDKPTTAAHSAVGDAARAPSTKAVSLSPHTELENESVKIEDRTEDVVPDRDETADLPKTKSVKIEDEVASAVPRSVEADETVDLQQTDSVKLEDTVNFPVTGSVEADEIVDLPKTKAVKARGETEAAASGSAENNETVNLPSKESPCAKLGPIEKRVETSEKIGSFESIAEGQKQEVEKPPNVAECGKSSEKVTSESKVLPEASGSPDVIEIPVSTEEITENTVASDPPKSPQGIGSESSKISTSQGEAIVVNKENVSSPSIADAITEVQDFIDEAVHGLVGPALDKAEDEPSARSTQITESENPPVADDKFKSILDQDTEELLQKLEMMDNSDLSALLNSLESSDTKAKTAHASNVIRTQEIRAENEKKPIYIYTSLAGGGFHMIPRTNRLVTILTANRVEFQYRDLGTDPEAKKIWKLYAKQKTLPGIVRGRDDFIGNWQDIEEANEDYRLRELLYDSL